MTNIEKSLQNRRTIYSLDKNIKSNEEEITNTIKNITELTPDAYGIRSQRVVVVFKDDHDKLWDKIGEVFNGKVAEEKINMFKSGYGTVLYFSDEETLKKASEDTGADVEKFEHWAAQSIGMLELNIWTALEELGLGANIQHYNPVIDDAIKEMFDIPKSWKLDAQMVFGNKTADPDPKEKENINKRVIIK